tara:strand:+ start:851 stop:1195 length:345 start_codon:yes stop_codon:yes gene_type:complete
MEETFPQRKKIYAWLERHPKVDKSWGILAWIAFFYIVIYTILKLVGVIHSPDETITLGAILIAGRFMGSTYERLGNIDNRMDKMDGRMDRMEGDITGIKHDIVIMKERCPKFDT